MKPLSSHPFLYLFVALISLLTSTANCQVPEGFVEISETIPQIVTEPRYYSSNNFLGRPVEGYHTPRLYLTTEAAEALRDVQLELLENGLSLKVFDAYRPQIAVDDFVKWSNDYNDTLNKAEYYPNVNKDHLFEEGYIAAKSSHTRGSTVDVTIVRLDTGEELDMGTPFDYFGPESWPMSKSINKEQLKNRKLLRNIMRKHGFQPLETEWWHFTFKGEPFPDTYFNFEIR